MILRRSMVFGLVALLLQSCILHTETIMYEEEDLVDVAYYVPTYETTSQLSARVSVTPAKDYAVAGKIITYQNYIFVNRPNEGIHVVDNSDPANPINLHFITIPGSLDMAIIDNHLYTDMYSELVVFDISDVTQPRLIEEFTASDVFYYNPYTFIDEAVTTQSYDFVQYETIDASRGIVTGWEIDIRREPSEEWMRNYATLEMAVDTPTAASDASAEVMQTSTAGSMTRFLPVDRYLYTINFNELVLFSIGENYAPNRFARLDTGTQAETLFQLNDLLFVGSTTGMLMYDVSAPGNPDYLNSINHFRSCDPVVADAEYAYVTLRGGTNCFTESNELQIIDIRNPDELRVVARQAMYNPHGLAIHEDHLIICDGSAGLKVVDVSQRTAPRVVTIEPIPFAYDIILNYPTAVVVGESRLYQYDLSALPVVTKTAEIALSAD